METHKERGSKQLVFKVFAEDGGFIIEEYVVGFQRNLDRQYIFVSAVLFGRESYLVWCSDGLVL